MAISLDKRTRDRAGASREAIGAHYDLGNGFYSLWLDSSLTYSAAIWEDAHNLEEAQKKKLDLHIDWAGAARADRVLDVGCGWGSLLRRLCTDYSCGSAIGLTLSSEQARYVRELGLPRCAIQLQSWDDHYPDKRYNSIMSIGALEHFVRPDAGESERIEIYSTFFGRCYEWLTEGSAMSLQTSAYRAGSFVKGAIASIFPESDLPRLSQIEQSIKGLFEIERLRNDSEDYALTCREWLRRLRSNEGKAVELIGEPKVRHFEAFLDAAARGFDAGVFDLLRIRLRRI